MNQTSVQTALSGDFIAKLEHIECSYWMQYYRSSNHLKAYSSIIDGGVACAMPEIDILAMNRVIGVGSENTLSPGTLEHIIRFYQSAGSSRFFIQLPPAVADPETIQLLTSYGFRHHNNWTKLYRNVHESATETESELTIRVIDKSEADLFAQIIFMSFDWEDTRIIPWLASVVGSRGYRHYIVRKAGTAIAAGALFTDGEMASMAFAGTLAPFRGLGAQTLLIKTRLNDALQAGATIITAETAEETGSNKVNSYRNMIKHGFTHAYNRQNWLFEF